MSSLWLSSLWFDRPHNEDHHEDGEEEEEEEEDVSFSALVVVVVLVVGDDESLPSIAFGAIEDDHGKNRHVGEEGRFWRWWLWL